MQPNAINTLCSTMLTVYVEIMPFQTAKYLTALPHFTASYRILPHFTAFYRFLPYLTAFYRLGGCLPFVERQTNGKRTAN
jgi:hypothetical protein